MSPCYWVKLPDGTVAHVNAGRGKAALCSFCKQRPHTKLCDYRLSSPQQVTHVRTCDAKMCDQCATSVGPNQDYCPNHTKQAVSA